MQISYLDVTDSTATRLGTATTQKSSTRHMNLQDVVKRQVSGVSVTSADGESLHTATEFLESCVEETDPDAHPV